MGQIITCAVIARSQQIKFDSNLYITSTWCTQYTQHLMQRHHYSSAIYWTQLHVFFHVSCHAVTQVRQIFFTNSLTLCTHVYTAVLLWPVFNIINSSSVRISYRTRSGSGRSLYSGRTKAFGGRSTGHKYSLTRQRSGHSRNSNACVIFGALLTVCNPPQLVFDTSSRYKVQHWQADR